MKKAVLFITSIIAYSAYSDDFMNAFYTNLSFGISTSELQQTHTNLIECPITANIEYFTLFGKEYFTSNYSTFFYTFKSNELICLTRSSRSPLSTNSIYDAAFDNQVNSALPNYFTFITNRHIVRNINGIMVSNVNLQIWVNVSNSTGAAYFSDTNEARLVYYITNSISYTNLFIFP